MSPLSPFACPPAIMGTIAHGCGVQKHKLCQNGEEIYRTLLPQMSDKAITVLNNQVI